MRICSLSSGSKGNSIFIESGDSRILIDIGLSALQIRKSLEKIEIDSRSIDAIVLTHSHRDHVRGCGVFSRQFGTPVYGHPETLDYISHMFMRKETLHPWQEKFIIKDIHFTPFRVSHDAYPTLGYLLQTGNKSLAVCTDLGVVTHNVTDHLGRAEFLIVESNHDPDMLLNGPYPWDLKERIASRVGHLSNHETGELLKIISNGKIEKILLAHLSEENNTIDLAKNTVLEYIGYQFEHIVDVLWQKRISAVYNF